jgi:hypothetical protein
VSLSVRERIHAAPLQILETVPGVALVERNRAANIPPGRRPFLVLLDGDESELRYPNDTRPGAPALVDLTPTVVLGVEGTDADVGPALNALIADVQRAIAPQTAPLAGLAIVAPPRPIGLKTSLAKGKTTEMAAVLSIGLTYRLDPSSP